MPNAERYTPCTACAMSALGMTMAGFLPPISTTQGFGKSWANFRYSCPKPTSYEPVNVSPATSG